MCGYSEVFPFIFLFDALTHDGIDGRPVFCVRDDEGRIVYAADWKSKYPSGKKYVINIEIPPKNGLTVIGEGMLLPPSCWITWQLLRISECFGGCQK